MLVALAITIAALLVPARALAQGQPPDPPRLDLSLRIEPGTPARYRITTDVISTSQRSDQPGNTIVDRRASAIEFVLSTPDDQPTPRRLTATISRYWTTLNTDTGLLAIDTDPFMGPLTERQATLSSNFRPLVGTAITIALDPAGRIDAITAGSDFAPRTAPARAIEEYFSITQARWRLAPILGLLPQAAPAPALEPGPEWEWTDQIFFPLQADTLVPLSRVSSIAEATPINALVESSASVSDDAPREMPNGVTIETLTVDASAEWNIAEGRLDQASSSEIVEMRGQMDTILATRRAEQAATILRLPLPEGGPR